MEIGQQVQHKLLLLSPVDIIRVLRCLILTSSRKLQKPNTNRGNATRILACVQVWSDFSYPQFINQ